MKNLATLLILSFCFITFSQAQEDDYKRFEIPEIVTMKWRCEEGVGNMSNPETWLRIEGSFNSVEDREFTVEEKDQLKLTIYEDGQGKVIDSSDYSLSWESDYEGNYSMKITYGEISYDLSNFVFAFLVYKEEPGILWGTRTETGSCYVER